MKPLTKPMKIENPFTFSRLKTWTWINFKNDVLLGFSRILVTLMSIIVLAFKIIWFPIKWLLELFSTIYFVLIFLNREDKK